MIKFCISFVTAMANAKCQLRKSATIPIARTALTRALRTARLIPRQSLAPALRTAAAAVAVTLTATAIAAVAPSPAATVKHLSFIKTLSNFNCCQLDV